MTQHEKLFSTGSSKKFQKFQKFIEIFGKYIERPQCATPIVTEAVLPGFGTKKAVFRSVKSSAVNF